MSAAQPKEEKKKPTSWPVYPCRKCKRSIINAFGPDNSCLSCGGTCERENVDESMDDGERENVDESSDDDDLVEDEHEDALHDAFVGDDSFTCLEYSECANCGLDLDRITGDCFLHIFEALPYHHGIVVPARRSRGINFCSWVCLVNQIVAKAKSVV